MSLKGGNSRLPSEETVGQNTGDEESRVCQKTRHGALNSDCLSIVDGRAREEDKLCLDRWIEARSAVESVGSVICSSDSGLELVTRVIEVDASAAVEELEEGVAL